MFGKTTSIQTDYKRLMSMYAFIFFPDSLFQHKNSSLFSNALHTCLYVAPDPHFGDEGITNYRLSS
jgi:hypothetical protein